MPRVSHPNENAIKLFERYFVGHPERRAVKGNEEDRECMYHDPDTGNKCIVGCMLTAPQVYEGLQLSAATLVDDYDPTFKPRYAGVSLLILTHLQRLHDLEHIYWSNDGQMTKLGQRKLQEIKNYAANLQRNTQNDAGSVDCNV